MPRILLAEDHPLIRDGIALLLRQTTSQGEILIDTAADAEALWQASSAVRYELVLLDLQMPGMADRGGMSAFMKAFAGRQVVALLSGNITGVIQQEFRAAGGRGVLHKTLSGQALLGALQLLLAGENYFPECPPPAQAATAPDLSLLSPRQRDIYQLLMQGQSNKLIARALGLTLGTVKNHVHDIYRKLEVSNRFEAISGAQGKPSRP